MNTEIRSQRYQNLKDCLAPNHKQALITSEINPDVTFLVKEMAAILPFTYNSETSFPSLPNDETGRFDPTGQCAVVSRLIRSELDTHLPGLGIRSINALGSVANSTGSSLTSSHEWVELQDIPHDPFIIDVTPKQKYGLGTEAPSLVMGRRSELAANGYSYQREREDTDEMLKDPNVQNGAKTWERYLLLQERVGKVHEKLNFYRKLFSAKVFIPQPNNPADVLKVKEAFFGEVFQDRVVDIDFALRNWAATLLSDVRTLLPTNLQGYKFGNSEISIPEVRKALNKTLRSAAKKLGEIQFAVADNQMCATYQNQPITEADNSEIAVLAAEMGNLTRFQQLFWKWIEEKCQTTGGIIVIGNETRDLKYVDTNEYVIVTLGMGQDEKKHKQPLSNTIFNQVHINLILQNSSDFLTLLPLIRHVKRTDKIRQFQSNHNVSKRIWDENKEKTLAPILTDIIKSDSLYEQELLEIFGVHSLKEAGLEAIDVAKQVLMRLFCYPIEDIFQLGDQNFLTAAAAFLKEFNLQAAADMIEKWDQGITSFKSEKLFKPYLLKKIYRESLIYIQGLRNELPSRFVSIVDTIVNPDARHLFFNSTHAPRLELFVPSSTKPYVIENSSLGGHALDVEEKNSHVKITFKRVPPHESKIIGRQFHYLHASRIDDENSAYGAYIGGLPLPFAWITFAGVDRGYKQNMYEHLGLEPHRVIEVPRGWSAPWTPRNTMSSLFRFSVSDLQRDWDERRKTGQVEDKPLAGFSTVINPNLGFFGHWLEGSQVIPCGFRPANFNYTITDEGERIPMPRRSIMRQLNVSSLSELQRHPKFGSSTLPQMPLLEMVLALDPHDAKRISQLPFYVIPEWDYERE